MMMDANTPSLTFCCFRGAQMGQEQPVTREGAPAGSSSEGTAGANSVSRSHFMDREWEGNRPVPHRHQNPQPQQQRQSDPPSPYSLQPRPLHPLPSQAFSHGPLGGHMTAYRGRFLAPTPAWHRGRRPAGTAGLLWGFQQIRRDFTDARLGYHHPAGQGSNMYRGRRGGGFNGM